MGVVVDVVTRARSRSRDALSDQCMDGVNFRVQQCGGNKSDAGKGAVESNKVVVVVVLRRQDWWWCRWVAGLLAACERRVSVGGR